MLPDPVRISWPHESPQPGWHVDIEFPDSGRPGQMPLPFEKIHVPIPDCQPDFRPGPIPGWER